LVSDIFTLEKAAFIKTHPYFYVGLIGLLLIVFGLILPAFFPKEAPQMAKGFSTPIIYFEFIKSPVEVNDFFGITDKGIYDQIFVNQMNKGNKLDFAFMLVYSAFLFLFFMKLVKVSGIKWFKIGMLLALLAFLSDFLENIQLLGITANLENGDFHTQLSLLKIFTWIKWGSLVLSFVVFSIWLFKFKGIYKFLAFLSLIPFVLGLMAYLKRGLMNELFAKSISIAFFVMICYCFFYRIKKQFKVDDLT
jgi:hypothetical protein